jgi:pimeloyl-ACP methyl ester carboxylesterase
MRGGFGRECGGGQTETVQTVKGPIEIGRAGSGPPVLFVHGTPGGADSSLAMGRFPVSAGFEVIAPSRPGYLGTALGDRGTIDEQADPLAALMDELGHDRAGVVTWSGGGPSSYRLAVRRPERVSALVPFAAVSRKYEPPKESAEERLMERSSFGNWLLRFMAAHAPKSTVTATLKAEGDLSKDQLKELVGQVMQNEDERDVVLTMAGVVADYEQRKAGVENDLARFAEIESLELEKITAPTLVIVGSADADVPPDHSHHAAATIPGAEKIVMDAGTHLSLFAHPDAASVQAQVVAKLR